jgi:hypothetical protein
MRKSNSIKIRGGTQKKRQYRGGQCRSASTIIGGSRKRSRKGGLSSQLVPLGLLAGVLSSRSKRRRHYPHKGMPSKTRSRRFDFITHKGDKFYNRRGKRQNKNKSGTQRRPF